jgi:cobyrinic acid a,c-diamide synthase
MKKILSAALILTFATITFGQTATAESTAKGLFNAWQKHNRTTAAKFATPIAVKQMFKFMYQENAIGFKECNEENGATTCVFSDLEDLPVSVILIVKKVRGSFKVVKVIEESSLD